LAQAALRICARVNGLNGWLPSARPLLVDVLGILLLNTAAVHEHVGGEVACAHCAPDVARKALLDEVGDIACVINMGMAEHNRLN